MARSLPLNDPGEAIAETTPRLSGSIEVYDPPMCCSTGVCGPAADSALLTVSRDLRWLEKQGVTVQRHGLSQEPAAFVAQPKIAGLMQAFGDRALPATLVNDEIISYGHYSSRDEIVAALRANANPRAASASEEGRCCAPGSCCC
jgi:hypothetical protein